MNIKDRGQATNAFKLLIFPDARVFQAPSPKAKSEWLEHLESTKHARAAAEQQSVEQLTAIEEKDRQQKTVPQQEESVEQHNSDGENGDTPTNPFTSWNNSLKNTQPQVYVN